MSTTSPAPGWYPDPSDGSGQRFWTGAEWSAHTRSGPAGAPMRLTMPAAAATAARMTYADRERAMRRANPYAWIGVVLGLIGLIVNVFGLASIAAIVLSSIGMARAGALRRSGVRYSGTVAAAIGLALGVLATGFVLLRFTAGFLHGVGVR